MKKIWKQKNDRTMETTNKVLYSFILASLLIGNYLINCTVAVPCTEGSSGRKFVVPCNTEGKFGWKCKFTCHCKNGEDCDKVTGHCGSGCEEGRYGIGCQYADWFIYGESQGRNYVGSIGQTSKNITCLSWNDPRVLKYSYQAQHFPDGQIPGPYCRNPRDPQSGAFASGPWCFIERGTRKPQFSYCDQLMQTECPDGTYGDLCDQECHCHNIDEVCDKGTGYCDKSRSCAPGWTGIVCQCPCPTNKYGYNCKGTCGNCYENQCDAETGRCLKGCSAGSHGQFCRNSCEKGTYGIDCAEKCGNCRYGDCDIKTGRCYGGCAAGYTGDTCKEKCSNGYWGFQCEGRCPYCFNKGPCHPETGQCKGGCDPGFKGPHCDQDCLDGFYGANCSHQCGNCLGAQACDKYIGYCVMGCEAGFVDNLCIKKAEAEVSSAGSAAGGIIAGAVIVLVLVILVILFILYRKRGFRRKLVVSTENGRAFQTQDTTIESIKETSMLLSTPGPAGDEIEEIEEETNLDERKEPQPQEPIYVNINAKKLTNPIPIEELHKWLQKGKSNDHNIIKKEHGDLPSGLLALCNAALKQENKVKNRYNDIIAYDHSRVKLTPYPHDPHSDYINANYIDGFNRPRAYIASQGPNKAMIGDFWKMIWQEKVTKVVMLTNLVETCKKKCEQYWPSQGKSPYGDITVETLDISEYTDYTIRTFRITEGKTNRIIKQFHFTSWTDHGAPTYPTPLLNFRRKVQQYNSDSQGPIVVHCSAGIGRTGTYIAVDYLLQQAKVEGQVDLLLYAQLMRSFRVNMIQTWQQYCFVYEALQEALLSGETTALNSVFVESYEEICTPQPGTTKPLLEEQFDTLQLLSPVIDREECKAALDPDNMAKSRFRNILPADRFRPHLFTPVDTYNDFINAVFLPSYMQRDAYIVTQMPMPNTVADFWRLLYDYHSDTVVMLNEFDRNDKSCALYWPEEYGYTVEYGPLSIELLFSSEADTNITVRTFKLTNTVKGEDRAVKQFQFNAWPDYKSVPVGTTALLRLTDAVQEWTRQSGKGPITVHCMNGASKSGLFCACSLVFERMRVDHEVDVYQTVKQIRINRPHFVENIEQYQFCFQMALSYLERQPISIERQTDKSTDNTEPLVLLEDS